MATKTGDREPSQRELQRKIGRTRDSLRTTVEAIQDKAETFAVRQVHRQRGR